MKTPPSLLDAIHADSPAGVREALAHRPRYPGDRKVPFMGLVAAARRNNPSIVRCLRENLAADTFRNQMNHAARKQNQDVLRVFGPFMTPSERGSLLEDLFSMGLPEETLSASVDLLLTQGVSAYRCADTLEVAVRKEKTAYIERLLHHCSPSDVATLFRTLASAQPEAVPPLSQAHPHLADLLSQYMPLEAIQKLSPEQRAQMPQARVRLEAAVLEHALPPSSPAARCRL